jgi:dipeptidyl aminopeptidase/acylaminoacyl peptidase
VSEASEAAGALTAALIVDGARAAEPVISPDGRWVAWTTSSAGGPGPQVSELWLAPVGETAAPVRLTDGSARLPRWSPDSAWLFYVADEELRRLPITAEGPAGDAAAVLRWRGEISGLAPLAGGRLVAVVAGDELTDDDERRKTEGDDAMAWSERAVRQHWLWHRLRLLDLASGELSVLAGLAGRHVVDMTQRPDGGPLAVVSWDCPEFEPGVFTSRLHVAGLDDGTAADLCLLGLEARSPAWWQGAGGWHVAWLETVPPGTGDAVLDITVSAGGTAAAGPENLTAGMTACPDTLVQVTGGPPAALFAEGLDTALYRLDPAGPSFRRVTGWAGRAAALSASDDATAIAVLTSTAYAPRDVSAGPPDDLIRISDTCPGLRSIAWGTQERLSWQASDGLEIDGILILPPGRCRADGPFPLVTMVHGGPYGRWADELTVSWVSWGQWLAAAGYAVFHPNPRGSQGHGQAFAAMVARAVGQDEWTDILAGLDVLVADGVADPARLGIAGWSHGGFMAAWAVTQTSRFRAAVMGAGIADWGMQTGVGEQGRAEVDLGGSFGWEGPGPHRHDQLSPISYAAKVTTPVLILHGEDDTNVPAGQAMYFHRALTQFGIEHELVIYPRENHSFTERAHQIDVLERTRSWFTRWLGGPAWVSEITLLIVSSELDISNQKVVFATTHASDTAASVSAAQGREFLGPGLGRRVTGTSAVTDRTGGWFTSVCGSGWLVRHIRESEAR